MENAQAQTSRYSGGALFNMTKQFDSLVTRGMALFNAIFHFKFCLLKACGASYLKFILNFLAALEIYFKSTFALQTIQSFMLANTQHKVPCGEKKIKFPTCIWVPFQTITKNDTPKILQNDAILKWLFYLVPFKCVSK